MHLIALAWDVERPGWLDPGVHGLARAMQQRGASCEVVTLGTGPTSTRTVDGVPVTWVPEAPPVLPATAAYDMARVLAAGTGTSAAAERRCQVQVPDAVLAFGWQTAWTATALRASRGTPLVAVLDSTAPGRAGGALDAAGRLAAQVEWWLTYEARRVVATSDHAARELRRSYRLPPTTVDVVPPGVDRPVRATASADQVVVLAPRPVIARVRAAVSPVRVRTVPAAVTRARVVVVLDDGAVDQVLAAMAAGAAVVVPDGGPLRELVHAGRSGVRVARDPEAVARVVAELTADPDRRARLGSRARQRVAERHDWGTVVAGHLSAVERAVEQEAALVGSATPDRPLRPLLLRSPLLGLVGEGVPGRSNGPRAPEGQG